MSAEAPLLKVSNIETYYGPVMAIRGVSFSVKAGDICTILGANGAGKTTILKTISGAMDPRAGKVEFDGRPIHGMDTWDIAKLGMSHVPEGREVFRHLSVVDNLMMGAYVRKDRDAVMRDLETVYAYFPRLKERAQQHAGNLSGGEQQMLALARAIVAPPRLLLVDEPSLGLSPIMVKEVFAALHDFRAAGMSILIVEQNVRKALALADHGYILRHGRFAASGPAQQLLNDPDLLDQYLGTA